jgi:hypothetical protein
MSDSWNVRVVTIKELSQEGQKVRPVSLLNPGIYN